MKTFIPALLFILNVSIMAQKTILNNTITSRQLVDKIIQETAADSIPNSVDTFKEGNSDLPVKGIITCMFATMSVLEQAVEKDCNLIIVHEPLYYNHFDKTEQLKDNPVYLEKKQFIDEHKLIVWRFHDYIHSIKPDGILTGIVRKLGWEEYTIDGQPYEFSLPKTTLTQILGNLKEPFPDVAFHVVGKPEMEISNVLLLPGAPPGNIQIEFLEKEGLDLIIAGEAQQWETYEYVRDAVDQGRKIAIVFIGHINSEDSGMEYCAEWLGGFIKNVPIHYIESGSSYWTF